MVEPSPDATSWIVVTSPLTGPWPYGLLSYCTRSSEITSSAASLATAVPHPAATFWILLV